MSEQAKIQTPERSEKPRFQFGMKYVMAAPVVLALFLSMSTAIGFRWTAAAWLFGLTILGLCFRRPAHSAAIVVSLWVVWILLLPLHDHPGLYERLQCRNNLKQIIIALYDYHDAYGSFPPAYIADKNGRPMHSWRVLILPFLEQKPLYDLYDLNEPWDGPNNRKLADVCVSIFNCPADNEEPSTMTSYLAVVGPNTAWPGSQPTCIMDFTDGTSNTLLLVEVANSGIHWMEPRDLHVLQMAPTVNPAAGQGVSSLHPGGANAAFADGSVRFLPDNTSPEQLRAMLTRSGGESVELEDLGQ